MAEDSKQSPSWTKLSGIGIELAAAVGGFVALGYWWDRHFHTHPWGLLTGMVLGLVGGMYNLIRRSLVASKEAQKTDGDKRR